MGDELKRFGVSMEASLLERFDAYLSEHSYTNRSEGIRDLVRKALVEEEWAVDKETVGAVTIVYNHHVPELTAKLNRLQHDFPGTVIASLHIHLDHDNCMEVVVARGKAREVKKLADKMISLRGVLHGSLTGSTTGASFKAGPGTEKHPHPHR